MSSDKTPSESPAQRLHREGFGRLADQLAREQQRELDASHGRAVGGAGPRALPPGDLVRKPDDLAPPVKK
jgi:hypothetical protein